MAYIDLNGEIGSAVAVNIAFKAVGCHVEAKLALVIAEAGTADEVELFAAERSCLNAAEVDLVAFVMAEAADSVRRVHATLSRGAKNKLVSPDIAEQAILAKSAYQNVVAVPSVQDIVAPASGNPVGKSAARDLVVLAASVKWTVPDVVRIEPDRDAFHVLNLDKERIFVDDVGSFRCT